MIRFMNRKLTLILSAILIAAVLSVCIVIPDMRQVAAEQLIEIDYTVLINDFEESYVIGAYTNGYDKRMFFSLRDLAKALNDTSKQFNFTYDEESGAYNITRGVRYEDPETTQVSISEIETQPDDYFDAEGNLRNAYDQIIYNYEEIKYERADYEYLELYANSLNVDGAEVRYFTYQLYLTKDLYMNYLDIQLMLDITIVPEGDHLLHIYTDRGYDVDINEFEKDGFFDMYNGVILGDATTGEILYGYKENSPDAIASTSKLMTYLIVARYLELGKIHMDDIVTISENASYLAYSGYGTLYLDAGQQVTVHDLLAAMMIISSNESAVALGEYIAGDELTFIDMMNEMADILGLETAKFVNTNGLPEYSNSMIASIVQNYMSAEDLFKLSMAVIRKYPEVFELTSQKSMFLETFGYDVNTTNSLLFNDPLVNGLKTGTTDEAGCCLVASSKVQKYDGEHILVAIVLGANDNMDRVRVPHVLLTYGANLNKEAPVSDVNTERTDSENPSAETTDPTETADAQQVADPAAVAENTGAAEPAAEMVTETAEEPVTEGN